MVKSFAFLTLLALFAALPSTFSANIPAEVGTSASLQAQVQTSSTANGSLKPMATPYVMVDVEELEKRAESVAPESGGVAASSASSTHTRPHYTSFLTARADVMPQAQASAVNIVNAVTAGPPGSTHAEYTTFYGARSELGGSQSGGNGQVEKGGVERQSQGGKHEMQYSGQTNGSGNGNGSQGSGEEELEYCDDSEEEGGNEDEDEAEAEAEDVK